MSKTYRLERKVSLTDEQQQNVEERLQRTMRTSGPIVDHYVELAGNRILESDGSEGGKPDGNSVLAYLRNSLYSSDN